MSETYGGAQKLRFHVATHACAIVQHPVSSTDKLQMSKYVGEFIDRTFDEVTIAAKHTD